MKSYPIVYQGDIATALNNIGITDFMILNDLLAVAYVADDFNGDILDNTYDNDEALKLKLFNAISIEEQFYE